MTGSHAEPSRLVSIRNRINIILRRYGHRQASSGIVMIDKAVDSGEFISRPYHVVGMPQRKTLAYQRRGAPCVCGCPLISVFQLLEDME